MGYSVYFMEQAGFSVSNAFAMSIGQYGMGAVGTMSSWFLMSHAGRRTLYIYGTAFLATLLLIIGCLGTLSTDNTNAQWAIGVLLIVYTFSYDATVGPLCYSLVPELSSTRLRNKSVVLARNCYNILGLAINFLTPYMLNPTAWNWGARAAFFWAGSCSLCAVYMYFRLPGPKDRTYSELDVLFRNGTPARKFKSTVVNPFEYVEEIKEGLVAEKQESALHIE
jgi:SP family general alpha glucoside:H+ symporter-like MFS transporter